MKKRTCTKCRRSLKPIEFSFNRKYSISGLQSWCKRCGNEATKQWQRDNHDRVVATQKAWREANKEKVKDIRRRYLLKKKYGLTEGEYEELFVKQGAVCAVCRHKPKRIHIDHCHETGRVRGILCSGCNLGIGHFRDDPDSLRRAADYLSSWR